MPCRGFKFAAAKFAAVMIAMLSIFATRGAVCGFADGSLPSGAPVMVSAPQIAPNAMTVTVWAGPYGTYFNGPFTAVTICQSGTTSCETIHGILVDTGSSGLRIFGQVNHLPLPTETASAKDLREAMELPSDVCRHFASNDARDGLRRGRK